MAALRLGTKAVFLSPSQLDDHMIYHSNWDTSESEKLFQ